MKRRNFIKRLPLVALLGAAGCVHWPGIDNKKPHKIQRWSVSGQCEALAATSSLRTVKGV